jgi:hypothetical protein
MNSSKFFAAMLIVGTSVFTGSAVRANDERPSRGLPNTVTPTSIDCGCATAASIVVNGKDKFAASIAQGKEAAATFASTGYGDVAQTGGAASNRKMGTVKTGNGPVYASVD